MNMRLTFSRRGQSNHWSPWQPDGHNVLFPPSDSSSLCYSTVTRVFGHAGDKANHSQRQQFNLAFYWTGYRESWTSVGSISSRNNNKKPVMKMLENHSIIMYSYIFSTLDTSVCGDCVDNRSVQIKD